MRVIAPAILAVLPALASPPSSPTAAGPPDVPKVTEVAAPPTPKAAEFSVRVGEQLQLQCDQPAAWWPITPGCQVRTPKDVALSVTATFTAASPGVYRAVAVSAGNMVPVDVTVTGGPTPPDPPKPLPPSDPLVREIRAAFAEDKGTAADMKALSALYALMVTEAGKPEYATAAALNDTYVRARDDMLRGALPGVRRRCGAEVAALVGMDPDAALTAESRDKLKALYAKLSAAVLEAAK